MRRFRTVGSLLVVALVALAACSSGGGVKAPKPDAAAASDLSNLSSLFNSVSSDASDASDFGGGASSKLPQGDPIGKIRIVNGLTTGGQPGPAIDVYDTDKFHVDPELPTADQGPAVRPGVRLRQPEGLGQR